jgi:multidrug transporter EmrE-like cation transporter
MKTDRWFYSAAGASFLVMMLVGFHSFVASGSGAGGRVIAPSIFRLDLIHGVAIASWYVLFFVQSLLIGVRNRRLHFKLGWSAVAIGLTIAVTGSLVAIRSVQIAPPQAQFFGMQYSRFLLTMLSEVVLYTVFVTVGIFTRKKPKIHRTAMILASFSLLAGATTRMPFLRPVFGDTGWVGLFGAVFCLGAVLLLVRCVVTRNFDRWFAAGYALWVVISIASERFALTEAWRAMATTILKL